MPWMTEDETKAERLFEELTEHLIDGLKLSPKDYHEWIADAEFGVYWQGWSGVAGWDT